MQSWYDLRMATAMKGMTSMEPRKITGTYLRNLLNEGRIVCLTFIKSDGSERDIRCTTNPSLIDKDRRVKGLRKSADHLIPVFDLEKKEWRSIDEETDIELFSSEFPTLFDTIGVKE
jgi:hypothetical protein